MKALRIVAAILLLAAGVVVAVHGYGRWYGPKSGKAGITKKAPAVRYHCPMHPNYVSDHPGDCPICGMKLVPIEPPPPSPADKPKDQSMSQPQGVFEISPERQQLIGVRYGTVERASATRTIRAAGKVEMDETRVERIHPKVDGWIENVFADFAGQQIKKGQPLLTLYSPEMFASQQEYLLALRAEEVLKPSSIATTRADTHSLVEAARKRLELWDLTSAQIEQVRQTGQPVKAITLYSPFSGYVIARNAFPRQRVTPDTELYALADLSRVWVMADVYEYEAPFIRTGQAALIRLPYERGRTFRARVNYVQPSMDAVVRTLKVRLELANPRLALKPGMYVDVEFQITNPARLMVASSAVLDSGLMKTVFVDRGEGHLEPRHVETGGQFGDQVEILSGLKEGERIVGSGTFLVDSESQLKSAMGGMAGMPGMASPSQESSQPSGGAGHQHD